MTKYNIIYTSPAKDYYLWNGRGFDKLGSKDRVGLLYSGKTYNNEDLPIVFPKCREVISKVFPKDSEPKLNTVGILVGPNKQ